MVGKAVRPTSRDSMLTGLAPPIGTLYTLQVKEGPKKLSWKLALALLAPGIKKLKRRTDYTEYGGAPILGFKRLAIKAHGRSNAKAISNAIKVAADSSKQNICNKIEDSIGKFNLQHAVDFAEI